MGPLFLMQIHHPTFSFFSFCYHLPSAFSKTSTESGEVTSQEEKSLSLVGDRK
jgi:hypothetical protein